MPRYVGVVVFRLKVAIRTSETALAPLRLVLTKGGYLKEATIAPEIEGGAIKSLRCELAYEGNDLTHIGEAFKSEEDGIDVLPKDSGEVMALTYDAARLADGALYNLSGLTLQSHIFTDITHAIEDHLAKEYWVLPDSRRVPRLPHQGPFFMSVDLPGSGEQALSATDWTTIQDLADGRGNVPLWRLVLAQAHRRRDTDMRAVVIYCATALDVAVQPRMPAGKTVNMEVFRGEISASKIPDLRLQDAALFDVVSRLWYTRHGIAHRGESQLYDRNPLSGAPPLRPLKASDVFDFLRAVPRAVAFVDANPP